MDAAENFPFSTACAVRSIPRAMKRTPCHVHCSRPPSPSSFIIQAFVAPMRYDRCNAHRRVMRVIGYHSRQMASSHQTMAWLCSARRRYKCVSLPPVWSSRSSKRNWSSTKHERRVHTLLVYACGMLVPVGYRGWLYAPLSSAQRGAGGGSMGMDGPVTTSALVVAAKEPIACSQCGSTVSSSSTNANHSGRGLSNKASAMTRLRAQGMPTRCSNA